ncbi:hypothetical protein EDD18DRAFT_1110656 [Armillaria luteobubalina]|uniref:Uncharacterized protein n=1 Tax=Armillaria luteobubalina TaxID=153913 RepID=A0AA39PPC0_9AGAR|nr:hypothetical protein EDD18DRAFT_1110656 [Armillaria luteobubalina]
MDLLEHSVAQVAMRELQSLRSNDVDKRDIIQQVVLLKSLLFMALFRKGSHKILEIIQDFVDMLSDEDDRITAGKHHRQILEDPDVVIRLKSLLLGKSEGAHHASVQCLSQLILKPEDGDKHKADQINIYHNDTEPWEKHLLEARSILSEQPDIWIKTLYNLLASEDQGEERLDASCLSRLVKIDSIRDDFLKNRVQVYTKVASTSSEETSRSSTYGVSTWRHVDMYKSYSLITQGVILDVIYLDWSLKMLCHLMRMIKSKNSKSKRAGVLCLSESFMQFKQKRVIQVLVHILCIDRWLDVGHCITLLQKITSGDSSMDLIKEIINALVAISTNGANLYRTQCFFHAIYGLSEIHEANPVLAPDASVMKTIMKAMTYPHSRPKAAKFLKSIAMTGWPWRILSSLTILRMSQDKARMMLFNEKIVEKILNLLVAFKDKPESGEWLQFHSLKYDDLLLKILSHLVTFDDSQRQIHSNMNLQEKLQWFITVPESESSSSDVSQ